MTPTFSMLNQDALNLRISFDPQSFSSSQFVCNSCDSTKPGLWTVDWTMDWTLNSIMDQIHNWTRILIARGHRSHKLHWKFDTQLKSCAPHHLYIIIEENLPCTIFMRHNLAQSLCFFSNQLPWTNKCE